MKDKGKIAGIICLTAGLLLPGMAAQASDAVQAPKTQTISVSRDTAEKQTEGQEMRKVRLTWKPVAGAVKYRVVLQNGKDPLDEVVRTQTQIYTNGCELDMSTSPAAKKDYYWKVCALNFDGQPISTYTAPQLLREGEINTTAPKPMTEFTKMDYAPLYPAYSWIPYLHAASYEIQVWKKSLFSGGNDRLIRDLYGSGDNYYDDAGYTDPGNYYWKIRALDADGNAMSNWSEPAAFQVVSPTPVAALGDSITHGGGAVSTGPGYELYNWETYSAVPIKNLGYSGNLVENMCERFERDVLGFSPRILIIMGGVNNYRQGDSAWSIIHNLAVLRDKCSSYGIIPVFTTVTPINPYDIAHVGFIETPPGSWVSQLQTINDWIMKQPYAVNVSSKLTDARGWLKDIYTTDGLHPDYLGKKYIGETISSYLQKMFPDIVMPLVKQKDAARSK